MSTAATTPEPISTNSSSRWQNRDEAKTQTSHLNVKSFWLTADEDIGHLSKCTCLFSSIFFRQPTITFLTYFRVGQYWAFLSTAPQSLIPGKRRILTRPTLILGLHYYERGQVELLREDVCFSSRVRDEAQRVQQLHRDLHRVHRGEFFRFLKTSKQKIGPLKKLEY